MKERSKKENETFQHFCKKKRKERSFQEEQNYGFVRM